VDHKRKSMKLVLLPGMDGTGLLFKPFIDLADTFEVDIIGYPLDKFLTYSELTDYVRELLPKDKEFILVAESFSGPVVYQLMKKRTPKLISAVFIASFISSPRPIMLPMLKRLPLSMLFSVPIPKFIIRRYLLGSKANDELIRQFKEAIKKVNPEVLAKRLKMLAEIEVPKERISYRCCYVQANSDSLVPESNIGIFKKLFDDISIKKVDGPHFLLQANPEGCLRVINEEIRRLSNRSG